MILWLNINAKILQNKTIYESSNFIISIIYSPFHCFWKHRKDLEIHFVFFLFFFSNLLQFRFFYSKHKLVFIIENIRWNKLFCDFIHSAIWNKKSLMRLWNKNEISPNKKKELTTSYKYGENERKTYNQHTHRPIVFVNGIFGVCRLLQQCMCVLVEQIVMTFAYDCQVACGKTFATLYKFIHSWNLLEV